MCGSIEGRAYHKGEFALGEGGEGYPHHIVGKEDTVVRNESRTIHAGFKGPSIE